MKFVDASAAQRGPRFFLADSVKNYRSVKFRKMYNLLKYISRKKRVTPKRAVTAQKQKV